MERPDPPIIPKLLAPSLGLNWRVLRPMSRFLKTTPNRVLHAR